MSKPVDKIIKIKSRQIIDSRSNPTIEVDVFTENGGFGRAAVPSGASTGMFEAFELRDADQKIYHGKSVLKAVNNVNNIIAPKLKSINVFEQKEIDGLMLNLDGTKNKSKLGANAILGVSLAVAKAAASSLKVPLYKYLNENTDKYILPIPFMNIINGGKHAGNNLSIQEFMIVPVGVNTENDAIRACSEIYNTLKNNLIKKFGITAKNVGDEGGFAPPLFKTNDALEQISKAVEEAGYKLYHEVCLAIDAAASVFFNGEKYEIDGYKYTPDEMLDYYTQLYKTFKIVSIEDPFEENQFEYFTKLTKKLGKKIQIVGDDLFVSNVERLSKGIKEQAANCLLLKVNQIGSLTEAIEASKLAFKNNYSVIVSHRSGETEDATISDLAVSLNCGQIKSGAPARGERTSKYNQLIRIEEELGSNGEYPKGKLGSLTIQ
ncbi:MAG: phosphopyruvate hydratase [Candidatus Odinarchaeia archaeon]